MILKAQTTTISGQTVTIRPIRKSDTEMEAAFIRNLSLQTKHYRFFCGVKELSAAEIRRFCDADSPNEMAFVATVQDAGREVEIGVCRYAADSKADVREMAVTIADEWQHKGLGKALLTQLISSARQNGVRQLHSLELADNTMMRELANEVGMTASPDPRDANQVVYSLVL
jgi:N-acetylglutamate synthase-like GNAT family acetyltransferase